MKPDQIGGDPGRRQSPRNSCGPLLLFPQWTVSCTPSNKPSKKQEAWERSRDTRPLIQFANLFQSHTSCRWQNGNTDGICEKCFNLARQHTDTVVYVLVKSQGNENEKKCSSVGLVFWACDSLGGKEGVWGFPKGRQDSFLQMFSHDSPDPGDLPSRSTAPLVRLCSIFFLSTCPFVIEISST